MLCSAFLFHCGVNILLHTLSTNSAGITNRLISYKKAMFAAIDLC